MKHLRKVTQKPARAQDLSYGAILSVIAEILAVIGAALVQKDAAGGGGG